MTTDEKTTAPDLNPLGEDATAADITASSGRHSEAAAEARARAGHARAEAEEILATAKERAEQILAAAEEQAAPLTELAAEADKQAGKLEGTAGALGKAAKVMSAAEEEDARAAALWIERGQLTAKTAELTAQAAAAQEQMQRLGSRRQDLETQLAGAAGDDDLAINLSGKISGIAETEKQLTAAEKRVAADIAAAQARITAIDREDPPLPPYPARTPRTLSLRFRGLCLVDDIWPGRPGAVLRHPTWYALNHGLSFPAYPPQRPEPRNAVIR